MKICSQCSAQNPDNARFCRNCGTQLNAGAGPIGGQAPGQPASAPAFVQDPAPAPDPAPVPASTPSPVSAPAPGSEQVPGIAYGAPYSPANPQTGGVKPDKTNEAKAFFAWLVSALKRPSDSYATHSWWAFVVMAVMSLLPALQIIIIANKAVDTSLSVFGRHISIPSGAGVGILVSVFFRLWLIFALIFYTAVLLAFIGRRLFGEPTTFLQMHDAMVQRFLPAAIAVTVSFLLSLFGVGALSLIIILITLSFIMAVPSVVVSQSENRRAADGFLLWCAFFVITLIALAVLGTVISSIVLGGAQDIINWGF
ncbi:DUF6574 domain-containing protein [Scardovia wiggsiae]|uniref:DUF6574 domain-containing protein n=1 Tax=Scardovia wiggsiae TaxID=230143 RepID=UPI00374F119C